MKVPADILRKAKLVKGKRSRVVVDHLLKHGSITTEDLERYGYKHPPRAIRDVLEQGLPLDMFWTKNSEGRKIAGYRFGDPSKIRNDRAAGRRAFPKVFRTEVIGAASGRCTICNCGLEGRYFQIDHRIPYEVLGDIAGVALDVADFMAICGSCNRAKSWSCEHCPNWTTEKKPEICAGCYWADPTKYEHVAMNEIRRLELVWEGPEVAEYSEGAELAEAEGASMPEYVKAVLRNHLRRPR